MQYQGGSRKDKSQIGFSLERPIIPNPISFFIYRELMIWKAPVFSLTLDSLNILTGIWIYIQLIKNASRCTIWGIFYRIVSWTSGIILHVLYLSLSDNSIWNYWRYEMWSLAKHMMLPKMIKEHEPGLLVHDSWTTRLKLKTEETSMGKYPSISSIPTLSLIWYHDMVCPKPV